MVRISDILRRMGGEEEEPPKKVSFPAGEEKKELERRPAPPAEEGPPVKFRDEIIPTTQFGIESAETVYQRLFDFVVTEIFEKVKEGAGLIAVKAIQEAVAPVMEHFQKGDAALLYVAVTRSSPDYYLHAHAVNSCILTIWFGTHLGYSREALLRLAIGSLLHDVGMTRVMDIAQKKDRLSPEEYEKIKKHPHLSAEFLKGAKDLPESCIEIAETAHERYNGKGYPLGLSREDLSEESQIIALFDVYEALTHPRSYRERFSPYEALKEILKEKALFNPSLLKRLLQQLTLYPVGCWVELSTGQQGQVIMTNPDAPLRPTVKVFFDNQRKRLEVPRMIHLSQHATLYVKRGLDAREVQENDRGVS